MATHRTPLGGAQRGVRVCLRYGDIVALPAFALGPPTCNERDLRSQHYTHTPARTPFPPLLSSNPASPNRIVPAPLMIRPCCILCEQRAFQDVGCEGRISPLTLTHLAQNIDGFALNIYIVQTGLFFSSLVRTSQVGRNSYSQRTDTNI